MRIEYRPGSLFDAPERVIVHGCNARGRMGAGIARRVRSAYPDAFEEYVREHRLNGLRLGQVIDVDCGRHVVVNAVTQDRYGSGPDVLYADYAAIRRAFAAVDALCVSARGAWGRGGPVDAVAMPLIGAGLANGSWKVISAVVEEESRSFRPVVYLNGQDVPGT